MDMLERAGEELTRVVPSRDSSPISCVMVLGVVISGSVGELTVMVGIVGWCSPGSSGGVGDLSQSASKMRFVRF